MKSLSAGALVILSMVLILSVLLAPGGCSEPAKARSVTPVARNVHPLLRGTIGSEVEFKGIEPIMVSGYGVVVGLNATGGDILPDGIAATMEREMGLFGIGKAGDYQGTAIDGKTPRQMLRDPNVAVVLVQAAIPPGAPAGSTFDVVVRAVNATSLEGGTLWTTDLRLGEVANTFGQVQARSIAKARGPIFVNPFAEPGQEGKGVTSTIGRVLDGGAVTNPFEIEVVLTTGSHHRTRSVVSAINSRFPSGPGDPGDTARGRRGPDAEAGVGGSIELRVPTRFRQNPADFLDLVKHVKIDQALPEQYARQYIEGLKAEPALADNLAWCLEALGVKALPFVRELYDYPELLPRMAALKAGARLNDARAASFLKEVAKTGSGSVRTQAISLLADIEAGPTVDEAIRELLAEPELVIRVAAYEALAKRGERAQLARFKQYEKNNPELTRISPTHLEVLAKRNLPGNSITGVERWFVSGKFFLDIVPGGEPLIYVTQQGQPRIVLFGDAASSESIVRPMVMTTWSERLMLNAEPDSTGISVYYRPVTSDRASTQVVKGGLKELIEFFARKNSADDPRPGLGMTYSEVVGALYALNTSGGTKAAFATERDKLQAQILAAASSRDIMERPETPEERDLVIIRRSEALEKPIASQPAPHEPPKIVPIVPPPETKKQ